MSGKRLKYFTGQLLNENDFKDEQSYHMNALSMHNTNLHSWGIASGLDIKYDRGKKYVTLGRGMAVDKEGRQILLEESMDIDLSKADEAIIFLTIALKITQTDQATEGDIRENTRFTEEPLIEIEKKMPDENANKIFLGKIILNQRNGTVEEVIKDGRKIIGSSQEIKTNSIKFIHPVNEKDWPGINGTGDINPGIDIRSQQTTIYGNLDVKGKLKGRLEKETVGIEQIKTNSIPLSKIKLNRNALSIPGELKSEEEKPVDFSEAASNNHLFFLTSVIPTSPGKIKWWWQTELKKDNQLTYILMLKNLSKDIVTYDIRYYGISEE